MSAMRRFLGNITVGDDCWLWGSTLTHTGYGQLSVDGRMARAHRFAYERLVGPIPDGLVLDHTCHDPETCIDGGACPHRRCVRPDHLEPVTQAENVRRGRGGQHMAARTHCPYGHDYTPDNTYRYKGRRNCRVCIARRLVESSARRGIGVST